MELEREIEDKQCVKLIDLSQGVYKRPNANNRKEILQFCKEEEEQNANQDSDDDSYYVSFIDTLSPEELCEMTEIAHRFFDDYVAENAINMSDPDFTHNMCVQLTSDLYNEMRWLDLCDADHIPEIREWVEEQCELFFVYVDIPPRQQTTIQLSNTDYTDKLNYLDSCASGSIEQRTHEWYAERDNMITASAAWKIFASDAQRNSLIYEKCQNACGQKGTCKSSTFGKSPTLGGVTFGKSPTLGGPTTMQWGTKYEPLSRELYMRKHPEYGQVKEYGCIPHRQYSFLGASPDGITENGRMLEIKNIVNREITGEPLEAYWIQMQIQMEVCDLEVCDFVETRFKEFDSERAFYESEHETKGVILQFMPRTNVMTGETTGSPEYVYYPLLFNSDKQTIDEWIQEKQAERKDSVLYYTYYWWLDEYSECVVQRNRLWFEAAIPEIEDCWNTVVKERAEGYGHRAPQSRKSMASILAQTVLESGDVHKINCEIPNNNLNIVKLE